MSERAAGGRGVSLAGLGVVLVAFAAGGLAGFAAGRVTARPTSATLDGPVGVAPAGVAGPAGVFPPILDAIGATAAQRAEIERILERRRPQTEALLRQSLPALRAITDSTDREIRAVLTPEQRDRLDRMRVDPSAPPVPLAVPLPVPMVPLVPGEVRPAPGTLPPFPRPPGDSTRVLRPGAAPPTRSAPDEGATARASRPPRMPRWEA